MVRAAEIDGGQRPGTTSEESAEPKGLKRENAELRRADEIFDENGVRSRHESVGLLLNAPRPER
ncbi:hypothetical protein HF519_22755 [Pseudonocardia bannensis]|uniref:Transposase n=1 Tax=Pseudonocardia bannensis TaxID=630973 RepID=A0A848DNI2_9PSEU|nr:hypothetical protein [Pseudonocardia bannensis]